MNEIRKNYETEVEILRIKFKIPAVIIIKMLVSFITLFASGMVLVFRDTDASRLVGGILLAISFCFVLIEILVIVAIKKNNTVVTNKLIKGVRCFFFIKKRFSYRLDEIENVEARSILGIHSLAFNFTQGHWTNRSTFYGQGFRPMISAGMFRISFVADIKTVYEKLSELITNIKNERDVLIDVEMSKVEVETKKVQILEEMVKGIISKQGLSTTEQQSYLSELRLLKELLDSGAITQEEYEKKKNELL